MNWLKAQFLRIQRNVTRWMGGPPLHSVAVCLRKKAHKCPIPPKATQLSSPQEQNTSVLPKVFNLGKTTIQLLDEVTTPSHLALRALRTPQTFQHSSLIKLSNFSTISEGSSFQEMRIGHYSCLFLAQFTSHNGQKVPKVPAFVVFLNKVVVGADEEGNGWEGSMEKRKKDEMRTFGIHDAMHLQMV